METPAQVAIEERARRVTYAELADVMKRLAALLKSHGAGRNERVVMLCNNGVDAICAIAGILRSDACYVPLNPEFPPARLASVVEDAAPRAIITQRAHWPLVEELLGLVPAASRPPAVVTMDADAAEARAALPGLAAALPGRDTLAETSPLSRPGECAPADLAYIMYTSGTTGKSKGVMISHRAMKSFAYWLVAAAGLRPEDRVSSYSNLSFDLSVQDIFCSFLAGATVIPFVSLGERAMPGRVIKERNITVWYSVPSVLGFFRRQKDFAPQGNLSSLRLAMFCGEPMLPDLAGALAAAYPEIPVYNLYGPTEATVACTWYEVPPDIAEYTVTPAGKVCPGMEIALLSPEGNLIAEPDRTGEMLLGGAQLAEGYWRRPDLTSAAFIMIDGKRWYRTGDIGKFDEERNICCLGRADTQIKYMGYRIELGDIEAALATHASVNEAAVIYAENPEPALAAFVSPLNRFEADSEKILREHAAAALPGYMIPQFFSLMPDGLPKNDNGKTDRRALKEMFLRKKG
jgi:amino acid adenylation domain-containing protein